MSEVETAIRKYIANVDKNWNYITAPELMKIGTDKFFLLDIRRKRDYNKGHIKGAKNIYWKDIMKGNNLIKLPRDKTILLVCYVGHTASQVLVILRLLGFDVKVLKFGLGISPVVGVPVAGWTNYGFPIEKN